MPKKSRFTGPFHKSHGERAETLWKAAQQHLYHIYFSLWRKFSREKSLLVICKILGLFVNSLIADDKYSVHIEAVCGNIFRCNYLRKEKYFLNFCCIFYIQIQSWTFGKKCWPSLLMYCWIYGLWKTWLDKCLKSPVLEDPSTSDMVNGRKHCWSLNDNTFTIFIYPCERNAVGKTSS